MLENEASEARTPGFKARLHHLLAVSYLASLCLSCPLSSVNGAHVKYLTELLRKVNRLRSIKQAGQNWTQRPLCKH